jgi:hypothetical protein
MSNMEPSSSLAEELHRDKIEAARRMSFAEKFLAGAQLFDYACMVSIAGIRAQFPSFDEAQIRAELRRRLEIGRRIEDQP